MDIEHWRQRLLLDKQELDRLSEDGREARATVVLDQQGVGRLSRIDAMQQQAMAEEGERRRRLRAKQIAAALRRIDAGAFGYCVNCGDEIPAARLKCDPASPICVGCAGAGRR
jgi:DnaK suppressor protein